MPPSKSGIADYSAALLEPLSVLADVTVFDRKQDRYDPASFDVALYQIGNNGYHTFVWEQAVQYPGVVVMHESNLHHLMAEMTIKRNDWDSYLRESEFEGGPQALAHARRVRALEVGPDYEGIPMLRRILTASRGIISHSHYVQRDLAAAGYAGPSAVIPHGAWLPDADRMGYRHKLGVDASTPLIGIFGFLKPYKRIAESLRVFRRIVQLEPRAKLILAGEPHPDFPLHSIIARLGIAKNVRILGFMPIQDFTGYIAACDIVLNLRWPTVGESSGTLLRAFGLGRAVIVSNVGSFAEYPDEICMKVPVGKAEEDTLFEYLNLLVTRPGAGEAMGARARRWVERECNWLSVAEKYTGFLNSVVSGSEWKQMTKPVPNESAADETPVVDVGREYLFGWAESDDARGYLETHVTRLRKTLSIIPAGSPDQRILEMGAYLQITPALQSKLGYGEVRGCYYGPAGQVDHRTVESAKGERFSCEVDLFDAEKDRFPYPEGHFDTVLCCELLEHLPSDPMHMMAEVNRILKPGGCLVVTTPNICSLRAISAILQGYHPGFYPAYIQPLAGEAETGARHAREYAPREIAYLFRDAGFELTLLDTGEFREEPHPEHEWARHLLEDYKFDRELRGDGLYATGLKRGPVRDRFPAWLYS